MKIYGDLDAIKFKFRYLFVSIYSTGFVKLTIWDRFRLNRREVLQYMNNYRNSLMYICAIPNVVFLILYLLIFYPCVDGNTKKSSGHKNLTGQR